MYKQTTLTRRYSAILIIIFVFVFIQSHLAFSQMPQEKPVEWVFSERMRTTTFDNAISLDNQSESWSFSRFKTNLGLNFRPSGNFSLNFRVGNEAWIWYSPENKRNTTGEVFVDQLFFRWKKVFNSPLDLTVGRQNLMFDEGFISMDGQPLSGSRSIYFNAAKGKYHFNDNSSLTAVFSYQPYHDKLLPVINKASPYQLLEEQTNKGMGLYYRHHSAKLLTSLYYFRKLTDGNERYPTAVSVNASGMRLAYSFSSAFSVTTEVTNQFGTYGDRKQLACGGYFHMDYLLNSSKVAKSIVFGGFYLSGDKESTSKVEAWNPMWGRWPKWSESYIYTLIKEHDGKVAYWSNISSLYANLKGTLSKKMSFETSYYHLFANQFSDNIFSDGTNKQRGDLLIVRLDYLIDSKWAGHFLYETFRPGNYYPDSSNGYHWMRIELNYKL